MVCEPATRRNRRFHSFGIRSHRETPLPVLESALQFDDGDRLAAALG
jgi:hypothetical protein